MPQASSRVVLFIETTHVAVGGVGARQVRLAQALPDRGWQPIFALTQGRHFHDPVRYQKALPPFDHCILDGRSGSVDGRRLAISDALRRICPDVVLPGAVMDAWAVLENQKLDGNGPRIVYGLPGINVNTLGFLSRHSSSIDAAFGVGPLTERLLRDYCGLPPQQTFLVPTGVVRATRQTSDNVSKPIRLLYVGRFDPDKRILDAIALADELFSRGVDFTLTLVGNGHHLTELESAAAKHNGRIVLAPPVSPKTLYDSFYPEVDAILLFSEFEGLPNSLLEGMAHGLVPITSDFRGRRELGLFEDNETALLFSPKDISGAAQRIEELTTTPELKAAIGTRAQQLIERERSVDRMANSFVKVLERSIDGPPRVGDSDPIAAPLETSRLRRVLGPRAAERVRRTLGVGFNHPDASEWPLIDNFVSDTPQDDALRLNSAIEAFEASFESDNASICRT